MWAANLFGVEGKPEKSEPFFIAEELLALSKDPLA